MSLQRFFFLVSQFLGAYKAASKGKLPEWLGRYAYRRTLFSFLRKMGLLP